MYRLNAGWSVEKIINTSVSQSINVSKYLLPCNISLKQHCKQNNYCYTAVFNYIKKYNLEPHEALAKYLENKQKKNTPWHCILVMIYFRYNKERWLKTMKAEILKHKVMLFKNNYFMSIYQDGTIHYIKDENGLKDSNFSVQDKNIFDKMFRDFLNHDYKIIA